MSDTFLTALILIPSLVIAIVFHEVAHGYVARALGDPTADEKGRLTLNPVPHVDPIGTLLVPGALALFGGPIFGWAKPVPVNKWRLSNPRLGMMAVAAAGPATNFTLALIGALMLGAFGADNPSAMPTATGLVVINDGAGALAPLDTGLLYFLLINIFLGLFNLLPIPPFDGSHILGGLLPRRLRFHWERIQALGVVLILGVIAFSWVFGTGWLAATLGPLIDGFLRFYFGIAGYELPGLFAPY
ncbi:MAG: site-2 protease family protein [Erythrobacter sp.]